MVRKRGWSLRGARTVALSTQAPLLGDLALDVPRGAFQRYWRGRQKWRCFAYGLGHGSGAQAASDRAPLRAPPAADSPAGGGRPARSRRRQPKRKA